MSDSIYTSGEYLSNNPTWHSEDSAWKAIKIEKMIRKNHLHPSSIAEIGCGAGEILNQLFLKFDDTVAFHGFEISPQAYDMCKDKSRPRLHYSLEDLLKKDNKDYFDLILSIDVIEHVEDYIGFLRGLREKAVFKIFHIPLELSAFTVLRTRPIASYLESLGHLHYFTKQTALQSLEYCGYQILDYSYTAWTFELPAKTVKTNIVNIFRRIVSVVNKDLAVRSFGGYSLLVLAK